jgi:hypothetical protein
MPSDEEALAYEMATVLERAGQLESALGVLSEIAAKAGPDYRDVSGRMARLIAITSTGAADPSIAVAF